MENIGDKNAAIAERVRALLAAANSSSATASAALPPSVGAAPVPPPAAVPAGVRRLESATDPATVVANLTVAGIRYAVSYFDHLSAGCLYHRRWIRSLLWIRNVLPRYLFEQTYSMFIMSSRGSKIKSMMQCGSVQCHDAARIRACGSVQRYDAARIRARGSGRAEPLQNLLMTRASGSADPGVRIVIIFMTTRGFGSTDPGVGTVTNSSP
jgi:hypothetical protein